MGTLLPDLLEVEGLLSVMEGTSPHIFRRTVGELNNGHVIIKALVFIS